MCAVVEYYYFTGSTNYVRPGVLPVLQGNYLLLSFLFFRRSTRPEVAQVHLINSTDGECASKAQVSAISKTSHQMTTVILAENKGIFILLLFGYSMQTDTFFENLKFNVR